MGKLSRKEQAIITYGRLYPLLHLAPLANWAAAEKLVKNGGVVTRAEMIEFFMQSGLKEKAAQGRFWLWKESGLLSTVKYGVFQLNTPLLREIIGKLNTLVPDPQTMKRGAIAPQTITVSFELDLTQKSEFPETVYLPITGEHHKVTWGKQFTPKVVKIKAEIIMLGNIVDKVTSVKGV